MRIVAILLAAGAGRRMGGPKALLRFGTETFLERCARSLLRPAVESVVVVLGHEAQRIAEQVALPEGTISLTNPAHHEGGMLSSLRCGLERAETAGADAVLVHPVDHPLLTDGVVEGVLAALREGAAIAVPSYANRRGHPVGFARRVWPLLRAAPAERGARAVLHDHPELVVHVAGDAACLVGVNTPEDLERMTREAARASE